MLQAIRSKTGSLIVKALAGVLILSFAAWGIEDVIGTSASELSVATVGKQDIPPLEFEYELARENTTFTPDIWRTAERRAITCFRYW